MVRNRATSQGRLMRRSSGTSYTIRSTARPSGSAATSRGAAETDENRRAVESEAKTGTVAELV